MSRILAPKDYCPPDLVYEEMPYARALMRKYKDKHCEFCHKSLVNITCKGCGAVKYCSEYCQKCDKNEHEFECKYLKGLPLRHEDFIRFLGRVIFKIKDDKCKRHKYKLGIDSSFTDLKGKADEIREKDERTLCSKELYHLLKLYVGEDNVPHEEKAIDIIKKVMFNTMLSVADDEFVGLFLYLGFIKLTEECIPNTNMEIFNGRLKLLPVKTIKKNELITIPSRKNYSIKAVPFERMSYPCKCTDCSLPYQESVLRRVLDEPNAYSVIRESKLLFHAIRNAERLKIPPPVNEIDKMLEKQKRFLGKKHALYMRLLTIKCFRIPEKQSIAEDLFQEITKINSMVYGGQILGVGRDLFYCQNRLI